MKKYLLIYFYVTSEGDHQGFGQFGPVSFEKDIPSVDELKIVMENIVQKYGLNSASMINMIEVRDE